jgi:hypothetical protein
MFPEIEAAQVDEALLRSTSSEADFVSASVDLLIEASSYLTIAGSLYTHEEGWTLPQAIVGGSVVRLHKLVQGFLDQTCQHRRELSEIFSRLMFETATNIIYFISFEDDALVKSYQDHSLKFERRLKAQIEERIAARGGSRLPIEDRMLASIAKIAEASHVDLESKPLNKKDWGDKNLFEKAEAIGWGEAYVGAFAGTSLAVHGGWGDTATHHLERLDDTGFYRPNFEWSVPRPQHPLTLSQMILRVAGEVMHYFGGDALIDQFEAKLQDTSERLHEVTLLHEEFLLRVGAR